MKKPFTRILSVLAIAIAGTLSAQEQSVMPCVTYNAMEQVFAQDPAARARYEQTQAAFEKQLNADQTLRSSAPEYTIPVVFHVLHMGAAENLSDAALQQALAWVNMDFDRSHSDVNTIKQPFQSLFIDSDIKFMLARKDPQGNCTNGIVHHYDARTVWDRDGKLYFNSPLYAGITWDPTRYLNIIVVREIVDQSGGNDVVGYTFKPGTHGAGDTRDAVVIQSGFLNTFKRTRYLTHEIGHWLNLSHTFGNTNNPGVACGDDGICDTPPTKGQLGGCPPTSGSNFACAPTATCGYNAGEWNVENIMDYSDCSKNFTAGQTNVMRTTLASGPSGRPNLSSPTNLVFTDVDGNGVCAPKADFASTTDSYTTCAGQSLTFREYTYNGNVTSINWSANNGAIVSTPNATTTSILFPNVGTVTVSLTVGNTLGSHVKSKVVTVVPAIASMIGPVYESFEAGVLPTDWKIENPSGGANATWKHTWAAAYDGSGSFYIDGGIMPGGQTDYLYTPIINMQASPVKELIFAYAYARETSSTNDAFTVQATPDCGGTWVNLVSLSAAQMQSGSGGVTSTPFVPNTSQWKIVNLATYPGSAGPWSTLVNSPHLQVRFAFTEGSSGYGNNIYIDAIDIPNAVGVSEIKYNLNLGIFPNPADDRININFMLNDPAKVSVTVTDLAGRTLAQQRLSLPAGQQELTVNDVADLAAGVYVVELDIDGVRVTEKLIVR